MSPLVQIENEIFNDLEKKLSELQRIAEKSEQDLEKENLELYLIKDDLKVPEIPAKTIEDYDKIFSEKIGAAPVTISQEEEVAEPEDNEEAEDTESCYQTLRAQYAHLLIDDDDDKPEDVIVEKGEEELEDSIELKRN
jgi:hypothetical protein